MPSVEESLTGRTPLAATLAAGVDAISSNQTIVFVKYVKLILPLDGFVFWLRSDLVGAEALKNMTQIGPNPVSGVAVFSAAGSLHFATQRHQDEDETISVHKVVFTALEEIQPFGEISPVVMFVGSFNGVRFSFGQRRSYYRQADLHHYMGDAIYPVMESQIIDSVEELDISSRVVSNSLPIWLSINRLFPVFPSYLVPDNMQPPYAAVHVEPSSQHALQGAPHFDRRSTSTQLVFEQVKVTLYGVRNDMALDYLKEVELFTVLKGMMGVTNMPIIRDEKRTQVELAAIAMKKSVLFDVNYYQYRVNDLARQLILKVIPSYTFGMSHHAPEPAEPDRSEPGRQDGAAHG